MTEAAVWTKAQSLVLLTKGNPNLTSRAQPIFGFWVPLKRFLWFLHQTKLRLSLKWFWSQIVKNSALRPVLAPLKLPAGFSLGSYSIFSPNHHHIYSEGIFLKVLNSGNIRFSKICLLDPIFAPSLWGIELILGPFMVHLGNFGIGADFCIDTDFWPRWTYFNPFFCLLTLLVFFGDSLLWYRCKGQSAKFSSF